MKIFSDGKEIEYSVTANGQFIEFVYSEHGSMIRATPYVDVFLSWMMKDEIKKDLAKQREQIRKKIHERNTKIIAAWWKLQFRGSFNTELYNKVLEAKNQLNKK